MDVPLLNYCLAVLRRWIEEKKNSGLNPVPLSLVCRLLTTKSTEYTECWPCQLFDIFLNKYFPAGIFLLASLVAGRRPQCSAGPT
jgi:hypothetical protein